MKHMKKLYPVLVLLVLAALTLAACGGPQPAPGAPTAEPGEATPAAEPTQPAQPPTAQPQAVPDSLRQLIGKNWQWTKTVYSDGKTIDVPNPADYTIQFFIADGRVAVKADCNNVVGSFTADANNMTITLGPSTMAMCPPGSLDSEFTRQLGEVAQYLVQGETLTLNFKLDSGGMTFTSGAGQPAQPAQPAGAPGQDLGTGQPWQWVSTTSSDGKTLGPENPADYTIQFNMADGKVAIGADCNNAFGDFMTDGQNLQIMIGGVTRAMCPPGSLSDEFLKQLSETTAYKVEGNTLTLTLSSGTMTLTAAAPAAQATAQPPGQPAAPAASLEGTTWNWIKTVYNNDTTVTAPDPAKFDLKFDQASRRFIFVADCNNGSGSYTLNGQNLTMKVEGMTRAACPPPSDDYIRQLDQVASYKIEGSTLYLMLKFDSGTMTFTTGGAQPVSAPGASGAATPAAPTGSNLPRLTTGVWKWQQSADSSGQVWNAPNPANYTIKFNTDGTLGLKADCNVGGGSYQADETNLTIQLGPTTLMACPPPALDNEFRQQLSMVTSYFFDGNDLILLWQYDSGSMKFSP
jgi:heat shock protein HslJ